MKHYVYWATDDGGSVLYIGCTNDLARRLLQHRSTSRWMEYADRISFQECPDLESGLALEARSIEREQPIYNTQEARKPIDLVRRRISQYEKARRQRLLMIVPDVISGHKVIRRSEYDAYMERYDTIRGVSRRPGAA